MILQFEFEPELNPDRQLYKHIISLYKQNPRTTGSDKSKEVDVLLLAYYTVTGKNPDAWALELLQNYITRRDDGKEDKEIITRRKERRNLSKESLIADYDTTDEHDEAIYNQLTKIMKADQDNKVSKYFTGSKKRRRG